MPISGLPDLPVSSASLQLAVMMPTLAFTLKSVLVFSLARRVTWVFCGGCGSNFRL